MNHLAEIAGSYIHALMSRIIPGITVKCRKARDGTN